MFLVFLLAAAIWAGGAYLGAPREQRVTFLTGLFFVVLAIQIVLPETHPLRQATGGDPALWMLFGGFVLLWLGYRQVLRLLRGRVEPVAVTAPKPETFSPTELSRYARHIVLRELGGPGQKALREAKVLVIGAGGLGAPGLQYLAAAGVGTIGVIDDDAVENANLQRQVIHRDADIGLPKVFSAKAAMEAQNPFIEVRPYHRRLTEEIAQELIAEYDLVLDGSDNFDTRYLVNRACVATATPLISGALSQWEGQLSLFDPARGGPCYACVFPEPPAPGLAPSCAEAGVLGPLPGVVGSMMAVEAVKAIAGIGTSLRGKLLIYDALHGETRLVAIAKRADCPVCAGVGPEPQSD
ncbi:MAG: HesA/MoeB/ThiF family protein [Pseudomonadota bacterium]